MTNNGYIKLNRKILEWQWYHDTNTFRVFLHLILNANYKDSYFENVKIKRGQVVISYSKLGKILGISFQQARTALEHLKSTGEITSEAYSKFSVITIKNYNKYQADNKEDNKQLTSNQQAEQQANNNIIRNKEENTTYSYKKKKESAPAQTCPSGENDIPIWQQRGFESEKEYIAYLKR